jgi:EAL domain-containing protein (putative c-di-GMP-specific phosphodiesterase class I)
MLISVEDVRRGLENDEFVPFFQPLVTLRTGQLAGFEVLARWHHPSAGILPPDRFIPVAEQNRWIGALTKRLMQKVFEAGKFIPDSLTLAFNVSPLQLHDLGLPKQIHSAAEDLGFPLRPVVIEITESAVVDNVERAQTISNELKALGCKIALDDFGTGYSNLLHLQSLPFDELKVDRSFVGSMIQRRESRKIVAAVVGLGQSLGLTTVAEGIETREQAEMLLWLGL